MNIKLGIGIDNFIFGMNQDEIEDFLGSPDRSRIDEEFGDLEPMIQYNSIKSRFTFYKNYAGKLGYIRSSNPELKYNDQKIIGKSFSEVIKIFDIIPKDSWELEEYDFWIEYLHGPYWFVLRFNYDTLSEIEMGVPVKNEEDYNWPKI